MKEIVVELKQQESKNGQLKFLRDIDETFSVNDSALYINIFVSVLGEEISVRKSPSYKLWIGKEITFYDIKNLGLGRVKYAEKLYKKDPNVRFVIPKKRVGHVDDKNQWFPFLTGDWEVLGKYDVVKSNSEEIKNYLLQLKKEQELIFAKPKVKIKQIGQYSVY